MKLITTALFSLAALHQLVDAWTITTSDAVASTSSSSNEPLSKTWTVSGNGVLNELEFESRGNVFVDYDASLGADAVARVVFSGDNAALLGAMEVANVGNKAGSIKLRLKNQDFEGQGYLSVQIFVSKKRTLTGVSVAGSGDAVIGDDALASDTSSAAVELTVAGSGDIYVGSTSTAWSVDKLAVTTAGSGDVQILAKSLDVKDSLVVTVAGSGAVGVVAGKVKVGSNLVATVAGSGDVTVQSADLQVVNLTTGLTGSGDVTYSTKGSCQEQSISIVGSGDVASGSIVCANTEVNLVGGSGHAVVQTTGKLSVSSMFSHGDVRYYGATPSTIKVDSGFHFRGGHTEQKLVKPTKKNPFDEYEVQTPPKRVPEYVLLKTAAMWFADEPSISYEVKFDSYDEAAIREFLSRHSSGLNLQIQSLAVHATRHVPGFVLFGIVGGALVAVGIAANKYKNRRERKQYQPLV